MFAIFVLTSVQRVAQSYCVVSALWWQQQQQHQRDNGKREEHEIDRTRQLETASRTKRNEA